jgi:hypothetical protein
LQAVPVAFINRIALHQRNALFNHLIHRSCIASITSR